MNKELEQLIADATPFNALPLLFHVLGRNNISISQNLVSLSRIQYIHNYLSTTLILRELKKVLSLLAERAVEVIVLKGAALANNLYPNLGLRPIRDVDFLIRREELTQVIEIMCHLGYQRHRPPARDGIVNFQEEVAYVKYGEFPIVMDAHLTLVGQYPYSVKIEAEGLWSRAKRVNLAGIDTLTLCPEDSLLHLCLHQFQHCQTFWLIPACDIAKLIRHYQDRLDWRVFLNRVFEFELCLPVKYSLRKTFEVFHFPIPGFVFNELNLYKPSRFENMFFALLSSSNGHVGPGILSKLLTIPGISQKIRYLFSIIFPSRKWLMSYYASSNTKPLSLYARHMKSVFMTGYKVLLRFVFWAK